MTGSRVLDLDGRIASLVRTEAQSIDMQTLTEVVVVGTRKITVTTTQGSDETIDAFIARHHAAVAALQGE